MYNRITLKERWCQNWSEYHVASLGINITQGHLLDLGMAGDLRELLYHHRVDLIHLLGDTLAVEDGVYHHSLMPEPVSQHLLGIILAVVFLQAESTSCFNVLTACNNKEQIREWTVFRTSKELNWKWKCQLL